MAKFTVTSPVKYKGKIYAEGATVEMTAEEAKGLHVKPFVVTEPVKSDEKPGDKDKK